MAVYEGWGRVRRARAAAAVAREPAAIRAAFGHGQVLAYGNGRSYGDAALISDGVAIETASLDRVLRFDPATGELEAEPGVTFRRLLDQVLPHGFLPPVVPGTGFVTLGGAVANDVHGKNHEHRGSFGQHVTALRLMTPDGVERWVTPGDGDLFRATVGGLGLTGVITRLRLRLDCVPGQAARVRERRIGDLGAFLAAFAEHGEAPYSVGWIDGLASGRDLGRGILETAEACAGAKPAPGGAVTLPVDLPGFVLNPASVAAFNALYWRRVPRAGRERVVPWARFLWPLDRILHWNRLYGRRGFHQFQCVVPLAAAETALVRLLERAARARLASFLAVIKRMGPGRAGFLSFPMPGFTLALDFPARAGIEALYRDLVAIARDAGGRVYLAKDALLEPEDAAAMYPELPQFRAVLNRIDPGAVMQSDLARRLALRGCKGGAALASGTLSQDQ